MRRLSALLLLLLLMRVLPAFALSDARDAVIELDVTPDFAGESAAEPFIRYGETDALGRCTAATACLSPAMRQAPERADISQLRPTGMHNARYAFVRDGWVYHRCHLIGRQLGGADELANLFTGTRTLNIERMLPCENRVAAYLRQEAKPVFYRVTPLYEGDSLVCSAVLIEALSAGDGGRGLCFSALCVNSEPGVAIDYATGYTTRADDWETGGTAAAARRYLLNTRTRKFHLPGCDDAASISARNRQERTCPRGELLAGGYVPCGKCRP